MQLNMTGYPQDGYRIVAETSFDDGHRYFDFDRFTRFIVSNRDHLSRIETSILQNIGTDSYGSYRSDHTTRTLFIKTLADEMVNNSTTRQVINRCWNNRILEGERTWLEDRLRNRTSFRGDCYRAFDGLDMSERKVKRVTEDCLNNVLTFKEACSELERCCFLSLEDRISLAMQRAIDTEMSGAIETYEKAIENDDEDENEDVISTDEFAEEFAEEEVEDIISTEYLFKQAEGLQTIDNDFAQAVAMVLFKSDERLKDDLKTVCEKHGKTTLTDIIVETKKNKKE